MDTQGKTSRATMVLKEWLTYCFSQLQVETVYMLLSVNIKQQKDCLEDYSMNSSLNSKMESTT